MKIGDDFEFLYDIWREGEDVPEMDSKPEIWSWLQSTWNDYGYLIAGRQAGWGVGPIPPSEVLIYAREMHPDWTLDRKAEFLQLITAMDRKHREFLQDTSDQE